MSKKRRKTSREKRALIGAVCTAAVILAGSTFAWFTSSDEVTNRLSASADYNVSAIENFTPPKNWVPGQKVKKEVAVVNTGNIEAFVKQEISGKITVTNESAVQTVPDTSTEADADNYVKLTADEVRSTEAGSFLAWSPLKEDGGVNEHVNSLGEIAVDENDTADFTPAASGLYVFRREIQVADNGNGTVTNSFEYVGYYALVEDDGVTYYKVKELNDLKYVNDGGETVSPTEVGILLSAPSAVYAVEKTEVVDVPLYYDATGSRLVATYHPGDATLADYAKSESVLRNAETDLETALANYNAAYEALTGNESSATDANSATAFSAIAVAGLDDDSVYHTYLQAKQDLAEARWAQSVVDAATDYYNSQESIINGNLATIKDIVGVAVTKTNYGSYADDNNKDAEDDECSSAASGSKYAVAVANLDAANGALDEISGSDDPANYAKATEKVNQCKDALKKLNNQLYNAYQAIKTAVENQEDKGLSTNVTVAPKPTDTNSVSLDSYSDVDADSKSPDDLKDIPLNPSVAKAQSDYDAAKKAYDSAVATFETAYNALLTAGDAKDKADTDYSDAETTYSSGSADEDDQNANDIVIYINLAADNIGTGENKWTNIPTAGTSADDATYTVDYYYNNILGAGENTTQLIQSVELSDSTTNNSYKNFDFDLNVKVDSAQVVYDDDNVKIKTDAVVANAAFGAEPQNPPVANVDATLTWVKK